MNAPITLLKQSFAVLALGIGLLGFAATADASLGVTVHALRHPSDTTLVGMQFKISAVVPDVPVDYDTAKISIIYSEEQQELIGTESGAQLAPIAQYQPGDPLPFTENLFPTDFVEGKKYFYRFKTEFLKNGAVASIMYYPLASQSALTFTAVPDQTAHESQGKPVDVDVVIDPNRTRVTLKGTRPTIFGPITMTLVGGSDPNNLTLFGGSQIIPAGTALPVNRYFDNSTVLTPGALYYVRLYIDSGNTHLVYPGATQAPIPLNLGQSSAEVASQGGAAPAAEGTQLPLGEGGVGTTGGTIAGTGNGLATSGSTGGLVPCGNPGQPMCGFNDIITIISNIINYVLLAIIPIATVMFIIIGFQYMFSGGKVELKTMLKARLGNLILGIVLVLGAWLLLATVLRSLGVNDAYILLDL